jgi:hypothetical protein
VAEIVDYKQTEGFTEDDLLLLDHVADLHAADQNAFDHLRALYAGNQRLKVPPRIEVRPYTGRPSYIADLFEQRLLQDIS